MKTRRNEKDLPPCAIPGCGKPANGWCGFCKACYSSTWYGQRHYQTPGELAERCWKTKRIAARAEFLITRNHALGVAAQKDLQTPPAEVHAKTSHSAHSSHSKKVAHLAHHAAHRAKKKAKAHRSRRAA